MTPLAQFIEAVHIFPFSFLHLLQYVLILLAYQLLGFCRRRNYHFQQLPRWQVIIDLDWGCALQELVGFLEDALKKTGKRIRNLIQKQVMYWMEGLPSYIRAYLPISLCES